MNSQTKSWQLSNEFAFSQTLVALAQLATTAVDIEIIRVSGLQAICDSLLQELKSELNQSHVNILPGILCAYI